MYQILSPDQITLEANKPTYKSMKECVNAFYAWRDKYKQQGYYSTTINGNYHQIELPILSDYITVNKFVEGEWIFWAELSDIIEHLNMKF